MQPLTISVPVPHPKPSKAIRIALTEILAVEPDDPHPLLTKERTAEIIAKHLAQFVPGLTAEILLVAAQHIESSVLTETVTWVLDKSSNEV